jgi:NADH:ubiquinone reductase (H+-translocating)
VFAFEAANEELDPLAQQNWLTFVVVGAGPTGVELAGALAEMSYQLLKRDFRRLRSLHSRVILVDMAARVLPGMSEASSISAERQLRYLGVELMLNVAVTDVDDTGVTHQQGHIAGHTVIWAAGVAASPLGLSFGTAVDTARRVIVNEDLSVPTLPDVFVIGDLAAIISDGKPVPGVAPAAMQEGRHAARNIVRNIRGQSMQPFHYIDKGTVASIGRAAAVAEIGGSKLSGLVAWLVWLGVHIYYLIGFRRRLWAISELAWLCLSNQRSASLITGDIEPLFERGRHDPEQAGYKDAVRKTRSDVRLNP